MQKILCFVALGLAAGMNGDSAMAQTGARRLIADSAIVARPASTTSAAATLASTALPMQAARAFKAASLAPAPVGINRLAAADLAVGPTDALLHQASTNHVPPESAAGPVGFRLAHTASAAVASTS